MINRPIHESRISPSILVSSIFNLGLALNPHQKYKNKLIPKKHTRNWWQSFYKQCYQLLIIERWRERL
jgi:hypothetical protein